MTREEAILLLHDMKDTYDEIHENTNYEIGYEQMTALDMAIEALSSKPIRCKDCNVIDDHGFCYIVETYPEEDGFCSWAERREP